MSADLYVEGIPVDLYVSPANRCYAIYGMEGERRIATGGSVLVADLIQLARECREMDRKNAAALLLRDVPHVDRLEES